MAKAIANESYMNFISVKGPELLNQYVGESEKNIREVFNNAKINSPCVLFFDEVDSIAPRRSKNSDSNNVMDRIVSQFMAEMDNINNSTTNINNVIIVASTNRPDLVDESLLRPGRFDKMIYAGIPSNAEERYKVLESISSKVNNVNNNDLKYISEKCSNNFSGADLNALFSESYSLAFKEYLESCNSKDISDFKILRIHLDKAYNKITPSLSNEELEKYKNLNIKYNSIYK